MTIPQTVFYPPFNITRVSHLVLSVHDLDRSIAFYEQVIGLVLTERDGEVAYLRGVEEAGHHSLVLKREAGAPVCERLGFRVLTEHELEQAEAFFRTRGLAVAYAEVPFQGRTLQATDPFGLPLEFCARMDRVARRAPLVNDHRGGAGLRFDHLQIQTPRVAAAAAFYTELGFRIGDYMTAPESIDILGAFMHRKDNPWDIVFLTGAGPRLHHFAYVVPSAQDMFRACDVTALLDMGKAVERGPGRHAMGHVQFVYIRDPDGHRCELLLDAPHQMLDGEHEPTRWEVFGKHTAAGWGLPAQRTWFDEATRFPGVAVEQPTNAAPPLSLEDYLAELSRPA